MTGGTGASSPLAGGTHCACPSLSLPRSGWPHQRLKTRVACNRVKALERSLSGPPCTALSCTHSPRARVVVRVYRHVWPYAPPSVCQGVWTGSVMRGVGPISRRPRLCDLCVGEGSPHAGMLAAAAGCCGVPSAYRMEASVLSTGMLFVRKSDGFSASGTCATLMLPSATRWGGGTSSG